MPPAHPPTGREVDVRGPRAAAWVTSAVLAVALLTGSGPLVAVQAAVFAVGAFAGLRYAPYGVLFRVLVAPRLGPVREREPEAPARFAQLVGLLSTAVGAAGTSPGRRWSAPSRPASRWWRPCSTRPRASAWAASCT